MAKRKKITYEISRVQNFHGDRESIVFHLQGDPYSFDSALAVENIKPGNPYETESEWIDWCMNKGIESGVEVINNVTPGEFRSFMFGGTNDGTYHTVIMASTSEETAKKMAQKELGFDEVTLIKNAVIV